MGGKEKKENPLSDEWPTSVNGFSKTNKTLSKERKRPGRACGSPRRAVWAAYSCSTCVESPAMNDGSRPKNSPIAVLSSRHARLSRILFWAARTHYKKRFDAVSCFSRVRVVCAERTDAVLVFEGLGGGSGEGRHLAVVRVGAPLVEEARDGRRREVACTRRRAVRFLTPHSGTFPVADSDDTICSMGTGLRRLSRTPSIVHSRASYTQSPTRSQKPHVESEIAQRRAVRWNSPRCPRSRR